MFRHGFHLSACVFLAVALAACGNEPPATPQPPVPQQSAVPSPPSTPAPPAGKVASGTIKELQAGDVACYVTLETSTGELANEMAGFEICEKRDLIGKKVALTWEEANVLAAECQGNVDCGKSDRVWLIGAVKVQ
jgi:hypothetical protein